MLLPFAVRWGLVLAGLVIITWAFKRLQARRERRFAERIPEVTLESARAKFHRFVLRWLPITAGAFGIALIVWSLRHGHQYVVVTDDGAVRRYGTDDMNDLPPVPDLEERSPEQPAPVWVLNRSEKMVRVDTLWGSESFAHPYSTYIPAGASAAFDSIDFIGPTDRPSGTTYNWLSW